MFSGWSGVLNRWRYWIFLLPFWIPITFAYLLRCFLAKVMNTIFPVEKTVEKKTRSVPKITDSYCWNFQKLGPKSWNNTFVNIQIVRSLLALVASLEPIGKLKMIQCGPNPKSMMRSFFYGSLILSSPAAEGQLVKLTSWLLWERSLEPGLREPECSHSPVRGLGLLSRADFSKHSDAGTGAFRCAGYSTGATLIESRPTLKLGSESQ